MAARGGGLCNIRKLIFAQVRRWPVAETSQKKKRPRWSPTRRMDKMDTYKTAASFSSGIRPVRGTRHVGVPPRVRAKSPPQRARHASRCGPRALPPRRFAAAAAARHRTSPPARRLFGAAGGGAGAPRGGPAASTRDKTGGSAVKARTAGGKSCGKRAVGGSARERKKIAACARTAGGAVRSGSERTHACRNWCRKHRGRRR